MVLDLSVREQTYVEDCEVSCNPIEISYTVTDEELAEFSARTLGLCEVKSGNRWARMGAELG